MANDAALTQLHPAVISSITNNTINYNTSSGVATMFCADVFECGKDNETQLVTTVDEFLFKYGSPNYIKYGQSAYNIINWLQSGGEAYVLRILPDDAGYAHIMLNIQTKVDTPNVTEITDDIDINTVSGKIVSKNDGNKVAVNNVFLRPIATNVQLNNTSENSLFDELELERTDLTIDGYTNNFLLTVYPYGRGSVYNKYGIRITLNETYNLFSNNTPRIYNFEVIEFDENENITTVEGPFFVSFDPDSLNDSQESLYIEDVVNKYSKLVKCKFNLTNYLKVAKLVNPNVNPFILDILTGQTREFDTGKESFYCNATAREEDIHFYIQRYGIDGYPIIVNNTNEKNIPNAEDTVENQIIKLDNNIRDKSHSDNEVILSKMKSYFVNLCTPAISTAMNKIYKSDDETSNILKLWKTIDPEQTDSTPDTNTESDTIFNKFRTAALNYYKTKKNYSTASENSLKSVYNILKSSSSNIMSSGVNPILNDLSDIEALYSLTSNNNEENLSDFLNFKAYIKDIKAKNDKADKIDILITSNKSDLIDISTLITNYSLGQTTDLPINNMENVLSVISEKITSILYNILDTSYTTEELATDTVVTSLKTSINKLYNGDSTATATNDVEKDFLIQKGIVEGLNLVKLGYKDNTITLRNLYYGMCLQIISKLDDIMTLIACKNSIDRLTKITPVIATEGTDITGVTVTATSGILGVIKTIITGLNSIITTAISMQTATTEAQKKEIILRSKINIESKKSEVITKSSKVFNNNLQDFNYPLKFNNGTEGGFEYIEGGNNTIRNSLIKNKLIQAYKGTVDGNVINRDIVEFRHILDANYTVDVKNAIVSLCRDIRKDCFFWCDTGFRSNAEDVLEWRKSSFNIFSNYIGIFTQHLVYYDEYTGKDIKVTVPYILSNKIPALAASSGLQYPIAGPKRGLIDGFKSLSWSPNNAYKERLYIKKINYLEQDTRRTKIGSQLTADDKNGPLSDINNMMTLLDIKCNTEKLVSEYQFEFNDSETISALNYSLNEYLSKYVSNRSCESISAKVYASDYDRKQKLLRVEISIKFNYVIERILISLEVVS